MFLNKWTVQLSSPGQILEQAFDSEEELLAFVRRMEPASSDGVRPTISVIDPEGKEKLVAPVRSNGYLPVQPDPLEALEGLTVASPTS